jgi:hypothetical protein
METGLKFLGARPVDRSLWTPFDSAGREGIARAYDQPVTGSTSVTLASGTVFWIGGCVVPAGATVEAATFVANSAAVTPTHQFFALAIPDEAGAEEAAVIAISKDDTETPWGANAEKTLPFRSAEGGSGSFTALEDTPVYVGICQVAATPAAIRGVSGSGQVNGAGKGFPKASAGPATLTTPSSLAGVVALSPTALCPWAFISGQRP